MTREENILKERFGKENPFKVPDGYFDHLTERIMENLPEQEVRVIDIRSRQTLWQKLPLRKSKVVAHAKQHEQKAVSSEDAAFNEMADYAMIDNETIYASLIAEN